MAGVCASIADDLSGDLEAEFSAPETATTSTEPSLESGTQRRTAAYRPIVMARKPGPLRELAIDACRIPGVPPSVPQPAFGSATGAIYGMKAGEGRNGEMSEAAGRWPANVILTDPIFDGDTPGVVGGGDTGAMPGTYRRAPGTVHSPPQPMSWASEDTRMIVPGYGDSGTYSRFFELPEAGGCYLCGRARLVGATSSPPSPSAVSAPEPVPIEAFPDSTITTDSPTTSDTGTTFWPDESASTSRTRQSPASRRAVRSLSSDPANNAARLATSSDTTTTTRDRWTCDFCADVAMRSFTDEPGFAEQPDSPRWFLLPKAARSEREPVLGGLPPVAQDFLHGGLSDPRMDRPQIRKPRANSHPTVKPLDLMRHLVRLVTPTGGTCLDPFAGSGTTALACELEGFPWIAIERELEYVQIIEARLNGTQRGLGLPA